MNQDTQETKKEESPKFLTQPSRSVQCSKWMGWSSFNVIIGFTNILKAAAASKNQAKLSKHAIGKSFEQTNRPLLAPEIRLIFYNKLHYKECKNQASDILKQFFQGSKNRNDKQKAFNRLRVPHHGIYYINYVDHFTILTITNVNHFITQHASDSLASELHTQNFPSHTTNQQRLNATSRQVSFSQTDIYPEVAISQPGSSNQTDIYVENAKSSKGSIINNKTNSSKGSISNIKRQNTLPFTEKVKVDLDLNVSCKNLEISLNTLIDKKRSAIEELNSVSAYPTPYILAQFASKVYTDKKLESDSEYEKRLDLPLGWKLLSTASNNSWSNGYFGAAYWNPDLQQVVVAHKGTDPKNLGALWTDLNGIIRNEYVPQMNSAITFADKINCALKEFSKKRGTSFEMFYTGHSLGGWLAQITGFTTKYLTMVDKNFLGCDDLHENYHTHIVVFDSPGCKDMLTELKKDFGLRYDSPTLRISLTALDITSYLSAPNRINTCNLHLGTIYRIFTDLSDMSFWDKQTPAYNLKTHIMDGILKVFCLQNHQVNSYKNSNLKIQKVVDWPISSGLLGGDEYDAFFNWAVHFNNYDPKMEAEGFREEMRKKQGYTPIRYQTKQFNEQENSINVFTQFEKEFLESYQWLRKFPKYFKIASVFDSIGDHITQQNALKRLKYFKIENEFIICTSAEDLQNFIPYVKRLLQLFPDIKNVTQKALSSIEIRKNVYQFESSHYLAEVERFPLNFKEDVVGLRSFINDSRLKVWQLVTKQDTRVSTAKIYKSFQSIKGTTNYSDEDNYLALKLKRLLIVNQLISLKDFFKSKEGAYNLLIIECKSIPDSEYNEAANELFKSLIAIVNSTDTTKIVLNTQHGDILSKFCQEESIRVLDDRFIQTKDKESIWCDLALESQKEILAKKLITFQGHNDKTSLGEIMGINLDNDSKELSEELNKIIDSETIDGLINENGLNIGSKLPRLNDLEVVYAKLYENIKEDNLVAALLKKIDKSTLFMISGIAEDELMQQLNIKEENSKADINTRIDISPEQDEDRNLDKFQKLCHDNPKKTIHWIKQIPNGFRWQQLYDRDFYLKRQLNYREKIVLKKNIKEQLVKENPSTIFVFSNITDEQIFMDLLTIYKEREKAQFLENFGNGAIRLTASDSAKLIFEELNEQEKSVHWIKLEEIDNSKQLIWHCSHGSLDELRNYVDDHKPPTSFDENHFNDKVKERLVIIADEPGMGKSTTLTSLSEQIKSAWVIRIDLKDCHYAICKLPCSEFSIEKVVEFLSMSDSRGSCPVLEKRVLQFALEGKTLKPMFLLFDGFDEIQEDYQNKNENDTESEKIKPQEKVIRLLQFLQKGTKANIWITTREYRRKVLENSLSIFATVFKKLELPRQKQFFTKFWKVCLTLKFSSYSNVEEEKLGKYAEELLIGATEILGQDISNFMGIPLQMRMLAEVFQPKFEYFYTSELYGFSIKLDSVLDLYQSFIKAKYNIYFKEKMGLSTGVTDVSKCWLGETITKKHRSLAFQLLFADKANRFLGEKIILLNENSDEEKELNRAGLIQSIHGDGKFEFIHRTFAEYFTADLLASWLRKIKGRHSKYTPVEEFLLTQIFLKDDYNVIRLFFNAQLSKNEISDNAAQFFGGRIAKLWSERHHVFFNDEHQTALHILAKENHAKIINVLLDSFCAHPETLVSLVSARDDNDETALYSAAKEEHGEVVEKFLNSVKHCHHSVKKKLLLATIFRTDDDRSDLVIKFLLNAIEKREEFDSETKKISDEIKKDWELIKEFLKASKDGNIEEVKKCLENAKDRNIKDYLLLSTSKRKMTALHFAVQHGKLDVVKYLLEQEIEVNARDKNSEGRANLTPLHYAAKSGHQDIVSALLKSKAEMDSPDRNGTTPLQHAAKAGKLSVVKLLTTEGADISLPDKYGMTALSWAVKAGHQGVVAFLWNMEGIDINAFDRNGMTPLQYAAKASQLNMVKYLVEKGADINASDRNGMTPISRSAKACKWDVAKYLVQRGAEVKNLTNDQKVGLLKNITNSNLKINDEHDNKVHKALYSTIHLDNVDLFEALIDKWQRDYSNNHNIMQLIECLPRKVYKELIAADVPLSRITEQSIEDKLLHLRFFIEKNNQNKQSFS